MGYSPQESLENRINTMGTPNFPLIHRVPFIQGKIIYPLWIRFFFTPRSASKWRKRAASSEAAAHKPWRWNVETYGEGRKPWWHKNTEIWTRLIWLRLVDILDTRIMCIYIYISVSDCSWWWCQIFGAWNELGRQIAALMEFQRIKLRMCSCALFGRSWTTRKASKTVQKPL